MLATFVCDSGVVYDDDYDDDVDADADGGFMTHA